MARIAGVNIPTGKRVPIALTYIHGIGPHFAEQIVASVGIDPTRRVNDLTDFNSRCDHLLGEIDSPTTLVDLSLAGIIMLGDRMGILGRLEDDIMHRLRYLDVRATDLVGNPTEEDLNTLKVEGIIGVAAAKVLVSTRILGCA